MFYSTIILPSSIIGFSTGIFYGILFSKPLTFLYKASQHHDDTPIELTRGKKIRLIFQTILWFFLRYIIIGLSLFFLLVKVRVHTVMFVLFFCLGFWLYILKSTKAS